MEKIVVSGSFDNIKSRHVRFLEEVSKFGPVHVYLWADGIVKTQTGTDPKFPLEERKYFLEAIRYVYKVRPINHLGSTDTLPEIKGFKPGMWAVPEEQNTPQKINYCAANGIVYMVIDGDDLKGFPTPSIEGETHPIRAKVVVTGCYDWLHSGHVRFFEETSTLGDLYVVVGHDENVRLLKGEGHPLFLEDERRYMVGAIKYVKQALVSSGSGWMDAEPEIQVIQPDIYAVNDDGDKPEKRGFCEQHGLKYVVQKRTPSAGLPRRESTHLRGF